MFSVEIETFYQFRNPPKINIDQLWTVDTYVLKHSPHLDTLSYPKAA